MEYHLVYTKFNKNAVMSLRNLVRKEKFYRQSEEKKLIMLKELCDKLCQIYDVPIPTISIVQDVETPYYCGVECSVTLDKLSIISFLHEFKHHIQYSKGKSNTEHNARGWSLSLYYQALPKLFMKSVKEGKIMFTEGDEEWMNQSKSKVQLFLERIMKVFTSPKDSN